MSGQVSGGIDQWAGKLSSDPHTALLSSIDKHWRQVHACDTTTLTLTLAHLLAIAAFLDNTVRGVPVSAALMKYVMEYVMGCVVMGCDVM